MYRFTDPFWAFIGRILIKPVVVIAVGISMLFEGYQLMTPTTSNVLAVRTDLAEQVCERAVDDLPKSDGVPTLAVLNLAGDDQGVVREILRDRLEASGEYRMMEPGFFRKLMREFGREEDPVSRLEDAVDMARKLGVDLVVFGEIPEFKARKDEAAIRLELRMAERRTGEAVFAHSYSEKIGGDRPGRSSWRAHMAASSKGRRIFVWVAFALLLPLLTVPVIRRVVSVESNLVNLALLVGYTAVDSVLALWLTGFWIAGIGTALILLLALAVSGFYNYVIASFIEEMSH
jgi:hypothetical protein